MTQEPTTLVDFEERYDDLTPMQRKVLKRFLQGETDQEIANALYCEQANVRQHLSNTAKKFGLVSEQPKPSDKDAKKKRELFRDSLTDLCYRFESSLVSPEAQEKAGIVASRAAETVPHSTLPINSPLYVERGIAEKRAQALIKNPGALLRIRAPQQTGKTSLVQRILAHTEGLGYRSVTLNFNRMDEENLESSDRFLRYFCHSVSTHLGLTPNFDHWDQNQTGSMSSCSSYIQNQILTPLDVPLVLILDNIHSLFEYPNTARAFTALLRGWNDDATTQSDLWGKLRQIIVYSTDIYIDFDLNKSPFNVGAPIPLPPLKPEQVQKLAWQYSLRWSSTNEAEALVQFLGGHPYLLQLALYELSQSKLPLAEFIKQAPTQTSIYQNHFLDCLESLQSHEELLEVFRQVLEAKDTVRMEAIAAKKLEGLGLIRRNGNQANISCSLYEQYFRQELNAG